MICDTEGESLKCPACLSWEAGQTLEGKAFFGVSPQFVQHEKNTVATSLNCLGAA